jgi:hypothetical protein
MGRPSINTEPQLFAGLSAEGGADEDRSVVDQVGQGVGDHALGILVDANISQLALDGQGRDAVHEGPERSSRLARLFAAQ